MNRSSYNWSTAKKQTIAIMLVKNAPAKAKEISSSSTSKSSSSSLSTSKLCSSSSAYTNQIINGHKLLTLPEITVQSADDPNDANDTCNRNSNNISKNYNNNNNYINNNNNNNINSNSNSTSNGSSSSSSNCCTANRSNNNINNNIINYNNSKGINKLNNIKQYINTGRYINQEESINLEMTENEEARNLQVEFEWVLRKEVHAIFKQLRTLLIECAHRFPVPLYENEGKKTEKFVLTVSPEQLKAIVTLTGDTITQADISFKLAKAPHHIQRTSIIQEAPWKLQQVQDAANYLQQAINHIDDVHDSCCFKTSDEVLHIVGNILEALRHGRTSLVIPKKKSIDELIKGRNMKSLTPNLTEDLAVSFYLQSHKLIIAIYQLTNIQGTMRFDSYQAEASVQWLNEVLLMLTAALKLCQQLKDKISVFSLYKDFTVGSSCAPPNIACFEKHTTVRSE